MSKANLTSPWTHGDATIVVNPAKQKKITKTLLLAAAVCVAYYGLVLSDRGPFMSWAKQMSKQEEAQKYEPTMRKLADAGKPDAILWMAENFPNTEGGRLDGLVRAGSGEAAWKLAGIKWKTDKAEAERLIQVAADGGFLPAVQYVQRRLR